MNADNIYAEVIKKTIKLTIFDNSHSQTIQICSKRLAVERAAIEIINDQELLNHMLASIDEYHKKATKESFSGNSKICRIQAALGKAIQLFVAKEAYNHKLPAKADVKDLMYEAPKPVKVASNTDNPTVALATTKALQHCTTKLAKLKISLDKAQEDIRKIKEEQPSLNTQTYGRVLKAIPLLATKEELSNVRDTIAALHTLIYAGKEQKTMLSTPMKRRTFASPPETPKVVEKRARQ
ncbi:hypothetical protein M426DRAFT_17367 [Hypoxylon sp. CI-4A]|nr:hypothetical protein M426DRAFT_17367 [Hypoxylon sp. CI-4A]